MTDAPLIVDPSAVFIDKQQEDLVDFIFRITADRSRAAVMGREACRQLKDELSSQDDESSIKMRLFQLAYDMNEEALRPIPKNFFENWFRHQHSDPRTVAAAFRWEVTLLELGQHAALLLLLKHRYDFSVASCAAIVNREEAEVSHELTVLETLAVKDKGLELADLKNLPHYGFLDIPELQQTALSQIMNSIRTRETWWARLAALFAVGMIGFFIWMVSAYSGFSKLWRFFRMWITGQ